MSGHSKWASIKHKKAATDSKRGQAFTRVIREIQIAARQGGGDAERNSRLRKAMDNACALNMPKDNIEKAILRGTGQLEGVNYEELTYEGYGPGGAALLVEAVTDNKNRTVAEFRHLFSKNAGNLGELGCVSWMFQKKGYVVVPTEGVKEDELMDIAISAGAEDIQEEEGAFMVYTTPEAFDDVVKALQDAKVPMEDSKVGKIPQTYVTLAGKEAQQMLRLVSALEDHDDVENVWNNADISEEEMEKFSE